MKTTNTAKAVLLIALMGAVTGDAIAAKGAIATKGKLSAPQYPFYITILAKVCSTNNTQHCVAVGYLTQNHAAAAIFSMDAGTNWKAASALPAVKPPSELTTVACNNFSCTATGTAPDKTFCVASTDGGNTWSTCPPVHSKNPPAISAKPHY